MSRDLKFDGSPALPLRGKGEIQNIGWDIPTRWAIDAEGQCWKCNAHGGDLYKITPDALIRAANCEKDYDSEAYIRKLLNRKPRLPDWVTEARIAGWIPSDNWDESIYE